MSLYIGASSHSNTSWLSQQIRLLRWQNDASGTSVILLMIVGGRYKGPDIIVVTARALLANLETGIGKEGKS